MNRKTLEIHDHNIPWEPRFRATQKPYVCSANLLPDIGLSPRRKFLLRRELGVYTMRNVAVRSGKGTARSGDSYHCLFASISYRGCDLRLVLFCPRLDLATFAGGHYGRGVIRFSPRRLVAHAPR